MERTHVKTSIEHRTFNNTICYIRCVEFPTWEREISLDSRIYDATPHCCTLNPKIGQNGWYLHFVQGHKYIILVLKVYITVLIMIWFNNEQKFGVCYNMFSCNVIALEPLPHKYRNKSVIRWTGLTDHKWTMNLLCRLKITVGTKGSEEI